MQQAVSIKTKEDLNIYLQDGWKYVAHLDSFIGEVIVIIEKDKSHE